MPRGSGLTRAMMAASDHKETDDVSGAARPAHESPFEADNEEESAARSPAFVETTPAPAQVAELASACIRFVGARYGATLDFEPETLSFLDQWVRDARAELSRRPEVADVVQSTAGAYLGEVIRRTFGGAWIADGDLCGWRLCLSQVYCAFNPIGMTREALRLEPSEGWHAHFELDPGERDAIEERLAALPQVDTDEYYAPSTRFDVVEILVEALRSGMLARGLGDVHFTPEDYV
ncbi:MAG TPA: DUF6278 family protein [Polyangiaceae bacterium]|nr:DUF6278 family protein [Polyangiaceae bacterium]